MARKPVPGVLASFVQVDAATDAITGLKAQGYRDLTVYTAAPNHEIEHALDEPVSWVRLFTLIGGLTGIASAFLLTIWSSLVWGLVTGGKYLQPAGGSIVGASLPPFFIIAFEMMVLFGGLATVIGMVVLGRLPRLSQSRAYDPRFSNDRFGVAVHCAPERAATVHELLRNSGAEEVKSR